MKARAGAILKADKKSRRKEAAALNGNGRSGAGRLAAWAERHPVPCFFLLAFFMNLLIESLARLSPLGGIAYLLERPLSFLLNTLVLFAVFSASLLFRRRLFVLVVTAAGWLVLGIANAVVTALRASPLSGIDFAILRSCLPIVKVYLRPGHLLLILAFLGAVGWAAAGLFHRSRIYAVKLRREGVLFLSAAAVSVGAVLLSVSAGAVETSFTDLPGAYRDYGFVTCFSLTVLERGIDEPEDYSAPVLRALAASLEDEEKSEGAEAPVRPNVVAVQLESFMDPERIAGAVYRESPTPYFNALKEAYPSGFMRVNTLGAGTANTEFEVLTGIDLTFFGAGEYPYQTVLEDGDAVCESLASSWKADGYAAHAVHNHSGSFYDRYRVYGALGFDRFVPLEYMNGAEENPLGWAKDAVLTDTVRGCLETTEGPDFVFAVSVQGHGLYPDEAEEDGLVIEAPEGWSDGERAQLSYYAGQMREMDEFLRALTAMLEERAAETGEETLLLLYGDHLPPLPLDGDSFADGSGVLDSEYVLVPVGERIGARLAETGDRDLEAWQTGMALLELTDTEGGLIGRCHRRLGDTPGFRDALRLLAYDLLYGERYAWGGEEPFERMPLTMGLDPVRIDGVFPGGGMLTVQGENFTAHSVVTVNGRAVKTLFVSPAELTAEISVSPGDRIAVVQRTEDLVLLGGCEPVVVPDHRDADK